MSNPDGRLTWRVSFNAGSDCVELVLRSHRGGEVPVYEWPRHPEGRALIGPTGPPTEAQQLRFVASRLRALFDLMENEDIDL